MPTKSYNVATAAQMVNVSASTIRGWCSVFSEHLSEPANPVAGKERRFTDRDIALLQAAKEMREQGRAVAEINQALGELPGDGLQPFVDASVTPTNALQEPTGHAGAVQTHNDIAAALRALGPVVSSVEGLKNDLAVLPAISERLNKLEEQQEQDRKYRANYTMVFLAGVAAGLLLLVLLLALGVALK